MATTKSSRQTAATGTQSTTGGKSGSSAATPTTQNAEQLLREDHRKVTALFKEFECEEAPERKRQLARQICDELVIHSMVEEEIFYPACRAKEVEDDALDEAQVEHDSLKVLIADVRREDPNAAYYDAKVRVLSEYVKHHVKEEEKAVTGIFAKARQADVDMDELGTRLQERKQQLTREAAGKGLSAPRLTALKVEAGTFNGNRKESDMARRYEDDRDRDDDNGFGPESGRGRYSGRYTREQDEETGGRQYPRGGRYSERGMGGSMGGTYGSGYGSGRRQQEEWREEGSQSGYRGGDHASGRNEGGSTEYEGDYGRGSRRESFGGEFSPSRNDDWSEREGGRRGGYSGSFERERDDYSRGMGNQDRGRMSGGRSDRDDDYRRLGNQSRFGNRNDDYGRRPGEDDEYGSTRRGGGSRGGSRDSGQGGWRDRD